MEVTPWSICPSTVKGYAQTGLGGLNPAAGGMVSVSVCLREEVSGKEELEEECGTEVGEYQQVGGKGQVLGSSQ